MNRIDFFKRYLIKKNIIRGILFLITFLVIGVIFSQTNTMPKIRNIKSIDVIKVDSSIVSANMLLEIENKSIFKWKLHQCVFTIRYEKKIISKGKLQDQFKMNKGLNDVIVSSSFYLDSLMPNLVNILKNDSILLEIEMEGQISFLKLPFKKKLFSYISLKTLTNSVLASVLSTSNLKVTSIELKEIKLLTTKLNIGVQIKNTLPLTFRVKNFYAFVYSDRNKKTIFGQVASSSELVIIPKQVDTLRTLITINNLNSGLEGLSKLLTGDWEYFLQGTLLIVLNDKVIEVPISQSFVINLKTKSITLVN